MQAQDFLQAGISHMQARATTYDKPQGERSMAATVAAFNAVTGDGLVNTEERGWLFMQLLKAVRSQQGDFKADNYEDGSAYCGLGGEAAYKERGQATAKPPSEWKANDRLLYIGDTCDAFNYGNGYYIERVADSEMISSGVVIQAEGDVFVRSNKGPRSIRFSANDVLQSFEFIA